MGQWSCESWESQENTHRNLGPPGSSTVPSAEDTGRGARAGTAGLLAHRERLHTMEDLLPPFSEFRDGFLENAIKS